MDCVKNKVVCDKYLTDVCREYCPYAKEVRGFGIGAMQVPPQGKLEKKLSDRTFLDDEGH